MDKKELIENFKEVKKQIISAYKNEILLPFIGAGFSENISKKYGWDSILQELSGYLTVDIPSAQGIDIKNVSTDVARRIEWLIWTVGKNKQGNQEKKFNFGKDYFVGRVKNILDALNIIRFQDNEKWKLHTLLAQKFNIVYTTNWDQSIERTHKNKGIKYYKIYPIEPVGDDNFISMIDDDKGNVEKLGEINREDIGNAHLIIKLHGDWNGESRGLSLIACETDYFKRITAVARDKSEIDRDLLNDLQKYEFLFIGYSFKDNTVNYIFNQLQSILQRASYKLEKKKNLYWILHEPSGVIQRYWVDFYKDRGITPIFFPNKTTMKHFLIDLFQNLRR